MAGQEIHRCAGAPLQRIVHIPGTCDPCDCRPGHAAVAFQEAPHIVPVSAVPLRPSAESRETSHLIKAHRVPGLRNQLHLAQNGVKGNLLQDRRFRHRFAFLVPGQDGSQVKAETVHTIFRHPIAQTVNDKSPGHGMVAIQCVAAPAEIIVMPVRCQDIVHIIVDSLKGKTGAVVIALRSMIEHHIQNDLNPILLQLIDQLLQLVSLVIVLHLRGISRIGRKEADRVIAPIIIELHTVHHPGILHLVKFKDRHQLHGIYAQIFQVRNLLPQPLISSRRRHS